MIRWGEPRLTRDVDLTILANYGAEHTVIDSLLQRFEARIANARDFALQNRVVLVLAGNEIPVDVALGALDFERRAVRRASWWTIGDARLFTCSAEDLIVHKAFAGRDQDWLDVEGIVTRQGKVLDRTLVLDELAPLLELKGTIGDLERLRRVLSERS